MSVQARKFLTLLRPPSPKNEVKTQKVKSNQVTLLSFEKILKFYFVSQNEIAEEYQSSLRNQDS